MGKGMRHRHPALTALQTVIADLAGGIDRLLQVSTLQLDRPPAPRQKRRDIDAEDPADPSPLPAHLFLPMASNQSRLTLRRFHGTAEYDPTPL